VQIGDGFDDDAIAITPDGQTAFVTQNATNIIVPVDLATGTVGSRSTWRRSLPASPSHLTAERLTS
jgi:DNA-binding beta-propeller fold protein YncE